MKKMLQLIYFLLSIGFVFTTQEARCQIQIQISDEFWGDEIEKVQFFGLRKVEAQALLEKMASVPGKKLEIEILKNDLKTIYNMKFFEQVLVKAQPNGGKVILNMELVEKAIIKSVKIEGNEEEDEDELKKQIKTKPYAIVDVNLLRQDINALQKYYEDKGFLLTQIDFKINQVSKENVDIVFLVTENEPVKVKTITFLGNEKLGDEELKGIMMTREDALMASLSGAGSFREYYFQADQERLAYYYRTRGYLQVNIANPVVTVTDDKRWIFITLQVKEGPKFTVNEITFSGDLLFSDAQLMEKLKLLSEQTYNEEILRQDILQLTEMYQDEGYAFANVVRTLEPVEGKDRVNIHYSFEKGQKAHIGKISVKGNTKTRDKVVRRELEIYEGMLYSGSKMRISKENVGRLGFFEKESVIFNSTTPAGRNDIVDVEIVLKERQTGQIQAGAGYSSAQKFFFQASVRQSNFRGLGQDLNFSLELASQRENYSIGFTEPYFMDTKWSVGGLVYKTLSEYIPTFDFERVGFDLRVGYPIFSYTRAYMTYSYRDTQVSDVKVLSINADDESGVASGVEASLVHDKRNNSFEPTNGYWGSAAVEYVGLGGDFDWIKNELEGRYYKTVWEDLVFRSRLRFSQLFETTDRGVPRAEKFSMGGPRNMRGFGVEGIGHKEALPMVGGGTKVYNVGGLFSALGTVELEHPLIEEAGLKWVLFADGGNVYRKYIGQGGNYDLRSDYGFGMRWFSPIGVLRFEMGFPINRKENEDSNQFHFDLGQLF